MTEIRSIDGYPVFNDLFGASAPATTAKSGGSAVADRVEISDLAKVLSEEFGADDVRYDRIAEIRGAISRGEYVTDEKLDTAIERALKTL